MTDESYSRRWAQLRSSGEKIDLAVERSILRKTPDDLEARFRVVCELSNRWDRNSRASLGRHVAYLIRHHPDSALTGSTFLHLHERIDPGYAECRDLWLVAVTKRNTSETTLLHAAKFLTLDDRQASVALWKRLLRRCPRVVEYRQQLAHTYALEYRTGTAKSRLWARLALKQYQAAYRLAPDVSTRFGLLNDLADSAFASGEISMAVRYANSLLRAARKQRGKWNYGNAIHGANTVLGKAALAKRDVDRALRHLQASAEHDGSPQLNSFGPSFELAKKLLDKGHVVPVRAYLKACQRFWRMDNGAIDYWLGEIQRAGTSSLDRVATTTMLAMGSP